MMVGLGELVWKRPDKDRVRFEEVDMFMEVSPRNKN